MENKNLKIAVYVLTGIIGFGLGLIIVGLFTSFMDIKSLVPTVDLDNKMRLGSLLLFDSDWSLIKVSPSFVIISYLVLLAGLTIVALDSSLKQKFKKKVKGLNFIGLAVSVVGLVLLIVSIIITKDNVEDGATKFFISYLKASGETAGMSDQQIMVTLKIMLSYDLGVGSILAIIGGVIAVIGSILIVIPAFDPIKLAVGPTANTTPPANSGYTLTLPTKPTGGGLSSVKPFDPNAGNDNNDTIA